MATSLVNSKVRSFTVWTFQSDRHSNVNLQLSCTKQILWRRSADRFFLLIFGYTYPAVISASRIFSADFRRLIRISAAAGGSSCYYFNIESYKKWNDLDKQQEKVAVKRCIRHHFMSQPISSAAQTTGTHRDLFIATDRLFIAITRTNQMHTRVYAVNLYTAVSIHSNIQSIYSNQQNSALYYMFTIPVTWHQAA